MGILQAGVVRRCLEGRFTFQDRGAIRPLFAGTSIGEFYVYRCRRGGPPVRRAPTRDNGTIVELVPNWGREIVQRTLRGLVLARGNPRHFWPTWLTAPG